MSDATARVLSVIRDVSHAVEGSPFLIPWDEVELTLQESGIGPENLRACISELERKEFVRFVENGWASWKTVSRTGKPLVKGGPAKFLGTGKFFTAFVLRENAEKIEEGATTNILQYRVDDFFPKQGEKEKWEFSDALELLPKLTGRQVVQA